MKWVVMNHMNELRTMGNARVFKMNWEVKIGYLSFERLTNDDNDNNNLYSALKPKRRKRIWGARSRDQSRWVLKIKSFKVSFDGSYGRCRFDVNWYFVPDDWCCWLKGMQAKICFWWVRRKKQWVGWTEISDWYVRAKHGGVVAGSLWV